VSFEGGRRTQIADVPPPSAVERLNNEVVKEPTTSDALGQLQRLADPPDRSQDAGAPYGVEGLGVPGLADEKVPDPSKQDQVAYQTRVKPFANDRVDVTVQAVLSADRRYVRLGVSPVFNVVTGTRLQGSGFFNPIIPGSSNP